MHFFFPFFLKVINYVIEKMVLDKPPLDSLNSDGTFVPGGPASGVGEFRSGLKPWQKLKPSIEILCNNQASLCNLWLRHHWAKLHPKILSNFIHQFIDLDVFQAWNSNIIPQFINSVASFMHGTRASWNLRIFSSNLMDFNENTFT